MVAFDCCGFCRCDGVGGTSTSGVKPTTRLVPKIGAAPNRSALGRRWRTKRWVLPFSAARDSLSPQGARLRLGLLGQAADTAGLGLLKPPQRTCLQLLQANRCSCGETFRWLLPACVLRSNALRAGESSAAKARTRRPSAALICQPDRN